jgi:hypothetical protein
MLPQEETRRVSSCTSFRRRGTIAALTLTAMARRRLRARVNWAMRWGGALACVGALLAYIAGCFALIEVSYRRDIRSASMELARGRLRLASSDWFAEGGGGSSEPIPDGPQIGVYPARTEYRCPPWASAWRPALRWGEGASPFEKDYFELELPLWIVFVAGAAVSGLALRSHRRLERAARPCPSCNYDLSGLPPGSPCPECATTHH